MTSSIESVTVGTVSLALDAAMLRHQAIASNIANANTPGYQPLRVSFEDQLGAMTPRLERDATAPVVDGGSSVALDEEVARLSANTVHYQALLRGLSKHLSILGIAANDGKR